MAYGKRDDGEWIEDAGRVIRLLADHHDAERHQRFVVEVRGQTLLIAHNLDLARRVPLGIGDKVRFRGIYEYNEQGGLVHWTHRDPLGRDAGGWVQFRREEFA
ncbi:MAG: DUF3465 domain-containing protein [Woeseiaceae bacterium]|nr:DUF3465 domain-containing protein [Woeseiaceae bacterium]